VSWIGADDHHSTMSADDFALLTDGFDAGTDFHRALQVERSCVFTIARLLVSVGDPTSGEVVRGKFNLDFVARKDPDVMHTHFSGYVGQHLVAVFEFDTKHCIGKWFNDHALKQNCIFLRLRQRILLGSGLVLCTQPAPANVAGESIVRAQHGQGFPGRGTTIARKTHL
jgi:hypothetical protein